MTLLIATYDEETGKIKGRRHVVDHDYTPGENEIEVGHGDSRKLARKKVDPETEEIVDDPDHDSRDVEERIVDLESRIESLEENLNP